MNYAAIKKNDIANGPGVRVSLFVSGCRHHCKNCFNKEAWDFEFGNIFTPDVSDEIIKALNNDYIEGMSFLGGEPFEIENQSALLALSEKFCNTYPEKSLWCYTGFTFEDLISGKIQNFETIKQLLSKIDVIVDGKFIEEKKDPALLFRGSSNQRIIDVKKSLAENQTVLLEGKWERTMGSGNIEEL